MIIHEAEDSVLFFVPVQTAISAGAGSGKGFRVRGTGGWVSSITAGVVLEGSAEDSCFVSSFNLKWLWALYLEYV